MEQTEQEIPRIQYLHVTESRGKKYARYRRGNVRVKLKSDLYDQFGLEAEIEKLNSEFEDRLAWRDGPRMRLIAKNLLLGAKGRARKSNRECTIDLDFLVDLLGRQAGKCAVSGIPFNLDYNIDGRFTYNPFGVSIDRIDSSIGYTPKNVRLVLVALNYAFNEWGFDTYLRIAKAVIGQDEARKLESEEDR